MRRKNWGFTRVVGGMLMMADPGCWTFFFFASRLGGNRIGKRLVPVYTGVAFAALVACSVLVADTTARTALVVAAICVAAAGTLTTSRDIWGA